MDYRASEHLLPVFDYGVLHLELNTAFYILVMFLIVMFALNRLLFQPVLRSIDNREALLSTLREESAQRAAEIERMDADYRVRLAEVREEAAEYRQEQRRTSGEAASGILAEARQEAEQALKKAMDELEIEAQRARQEVMAGVTALSERISERILQT